MSALKHVRCTGPGISRRRQGRGFTYVHPNGQSVRDDATRERIRSLAIPPAWKDVWICPDERGHLQAVGTDAAGRKQYLYHEDWTTRRGRQKLDRVLRLARRLPEMRRVSDRDIASRVLTRQRVLAGAIRLLDLGFFRIGSEAYTEENGSYGLATLRRTHVRVSGDEVRFDFAAKGGQRRIQTIRDPALALLTSALLRRKGGGRELLDFRVGKTWRDVRSEDINAYL
jgi:DNA topoisomerase-1